MVLWLLGRKTRQNLKHLDVRMHIDQTTHLPCNRTFADGVSYIIVHAERIPMKSISLANLVL